MEQTVESQIQQMLLSQMNVIVSHEMRNAINSIHCQQLMQVQLNERLCLLFDSQLKQQPEQKKAYTKIRQQIQESLLILMSSESLLRNYVYNILDTTHIKYGTFTKQISRFSIHDIVEEAVLI